MMLKKYNELPKSMNAEIRGKKDCYRFKFRWDTEGVNTMWFWKKEKNKLTTEYDAMEESKKRMKAFEEKYNIYSVDVYNKTCDMNVFEGSDRYLWEAYIRSFIRCGGILEVVTVSADK